jgi:hypothetical protein
MRRAATIPGSASSTSTARSPARGVAQLNPELPWSEGDTMVEAGAIDLLVPAAEPPLELLARPPSPVEQSQAHSAGNADSGSIRARSATGSPR